MSEAFDQAVAEIAAKYNTSSENVTRIASRNPALASFDPDNAAAWKPTDTITDNVGMGGGSLPSTGLRPSLSGREPGVSVLSDELLATLREGFLKAGESKDHSLGGSLLKIGTTALDVISTPLHGVVSTIKEIGDLFDDEESFSLKDWKRQTFDDDIFFGDVLDEWAPGLGEIELFGYKPLDNIAGFVGDVLLDPFTWLTLGTLPLAKQGTMGVVRLGLKTGGGATDDIARQIFNNGIRAAKADDLGRLTKAGQAAGLLGADDIIKGGLQFRLPFGKTLSRLSSGPTRAKYVQVLGQDNPLLKVLPRTWANTGFQKIRRSKFGGLFGGDMQTWKKIVRDPTSSITDWKAAFLSIDANNLGKGIGKQLNNQLENVWQSIARRLVDANINGKDAYNAMGSDVLPAGMDAGLWRELKDFGDMVRTEANQAVTANKMPDVNGNVAVEDWIRHRANWQPAVQSQEVAEGISEWARQARRGLAADNTKLQSFEMKAKIVAGEEFMGVPLVDASAHPFKKTPREQALEIMESAEQEWGGDIVKWFEDDLFEAMPQHISMLSRRVQGKFAENYLIQNGIAITREIADDKAILASKAYRSKQAQVAKWDGAVADAEATHNHVVSQSATASAEEVQAALDVAQARRARSQRWGVNLDPPTNGQVWRDAGEDLNTAADEARVALDRLNAGHAGAVEELESAATASLKAANDADMSYHRIQKGLGELAETRRALWAEGEDLARAYDDNFEGAADVLDRLAELDTEIRQIDDVISQARADYLLSLGDPAAPMELIKKANAVVEGGTAMSAVAKRAMQLTEAIYRADSSFDRQVVAALNAELSPLLKQLGMPSGNVSSFGSPALDLHKKIKALKTNIDATVVAHKRMSGTITDTLEWSPERVNFRDAEKVRQDLANEVNDLVDLLDDEISPELLAEIELGVRQLGVSAKGYLTYGGDQVVWFHGVNSNFASMDLGAQVAAGDRVTRELDSFLGIHSAQNVEYASLYAGEFGEAAETSDSLLGFLVRSDNPAIYGGTIADISTANKMPDPADWSHRIRGSGLALIHGDMLDSGFKNGHYGLEDLEAAGIPNAKEIWLLMQGRDVNRRIVSRPLSYTEAAIKFADQSSLDSTTQIIDLMMDSHFVSEFMRKTLGNSVDGEPWGSAALRRRFVNTLRGLEQQGDQAISKFKAAQATGQHIGKHEDEYIELVAALEHGLSTRVKFDPTKQIVPPTDAKLGTYQGIPKADDAREWPPPNMSVQDAILSNAGGFFDDFIYPLTNNSHWSVSGRSIDDVDEILQSVARDFKQELKGRGHDSIMYPIRQDSGSWAVITFDHAQLEIPPSVLGTSESGFNRAALDVSTDQGVAVRAAADQPPPRAVLEDLEDTSDQLYGSQAGQDMAKTKYTGDPELHKAVDQLDEVLQDLAPYADLSAMNTASWGKTVGRYRHLLDEQSGLWNELANPTDQIRRAERGLRSEVTSILPRMNAMRGRAGQLLGQMRKQYRQGLDDLGVNDIDDLIDLQEVVEEIDIDLIASLKNMIDGQERFLSETMEATQKLRLAVDAANELGAAKVYATTASGFVKTIDDARALMRTKRLELMQEKFDEAEALGDVGRDMHGAADQAKRQADKNRKIVRDRRRKIRNLEDAHDDASIKLEQEELRLRGEADDMYRAADRLEREHYDNMQKQFGVLHQNVQVAEANQKLLAAEALRLQAQAKQAEADLIFRQGYRDILADQFSSLSMPARLTMLGKAMDGWVNFGSTHQLPEDVARGFTELGQTMGPRNGPSFILRSVDKVNDLFKAWAIASPGFHSRNFMGGTFNNALAGVSVGSYKRFHSMYTPVRRVMDAGGTVDEQVMALRSSSQGLRLKQTPKGTKLLNDMELMVRMGVLTGGQTTELGRIVKGARQGGALNPLNPNNLVAGGLRKPTMHVENYLRGALALDRLTTGATIEQAVADVFKYHFDYDNLSAFERGVMRRVFPFYTWTRNNLPLQLEMMATNPKIYNRAGSLKAEIEQDTEGEANTPKWIAERFNIQLPWTRNGNSIFLVPDLPFTDVDESFNLRRVAAQTSPLIKVPLEMLGKRDLFFDAEYRGRQEPLPSAWKVILAPAIPALYAAGMIEHDEDGVMTATKEHMRWFESFLPVMATSRRLFRTEGDPKSGERWLQNIVNWTSGAGIRETLPRDVEFEKFRRNNPSFFEN